MHSFVRCPNCSQKLLLQTDEEGKRKRCPRCSTRFAIGGQLRIVRGLVEYLGFELFDQDPVDEIEVLDDGPDDDIEVLDEPPQSRAVRVIPVQPIPVQITPPVQRPPQRKRPPDHQGGGEQEPDEGYNEYEDYLRNPYLAEYQFDPRDRGRWNMVQWGITLVLLPVLLYLAAFGISFSSLFVGMGSGLELGGAVFVGGLIMVASDVLRLIGYGLCINTPGKPSVRLWAIIALVLSIGAGGIVVIPLAAAEALGEKAAVLGLYGIGMIIAMSAWGAYLMYLEGLAEMFNERGIADSVAALIKLGATYTLCVLTLYISLVVMVLSHAAKNGIASTSDPSDLVAGVCWGICCAFTSILGLVVFIKYILALLNIRAMIDWCT